MSSPLAQKVWLFGMGQIVVSGQVVVLRPLAK